MNCNRNKLLLLVISITQSVIMSGCSTVDTYLPELIDPNLSPPVLDSSVVLAEAPPAVYTLDVGSDNIPIIAGQAKTITINGKKTHVALNNPLTKTFSKLGLEFQYNADMAFQLIDPNNITPQWKLSGTHISIRFSGHWNVPTDSVEGYLSEYLMEEYRNSLNAKCTKSVCQLETSDESERMRENALGPRYLFIYKRLNTIRPL